MSRNNIDALVEKLLEQDLTEESRMLVRCIQNESGNLLLSYKDSIIQEIDKLTGYDENALIPRNNIVEILTHIGE